VRFGRRLIPAGMRARLPRRTVRLRLALLYGGLFFISGAVLLGLTYTVAARTHATISQSLHSPFGGHSSAATPGSGSGPVPAVPTVPTVPKYQQVGPARRGVRPPGVTASFIESHQRSADLHVLAIVSVLALAVMAAISIGLGWLIAGRVLRPLRTITTAAREISATNLHRRLALAGPDDEFKELGDTFDGLLGRLETSFQAQRQFVANASHELRTPLARLKTLAQVALADPNASENSLRTAHERVLAAEQQLEELIEALLTLAGGERALDRRHPVDLAAVTDQVLAARRPEIVQRGLQLDAALDPARAEGDARLLERLVANLVDNAILHNTTPGRIDVTTTTTAGQAVLSVANSGPVIPPQELDRLQRPFQRLGADRTARGDGHGLGLSIIDAIATAHKATVSILAQPQGGLDVEVRFPAQHPG
jgi:signal transduction histidine kinase